MHVAAEEASSGSPRSVVPWVGLAISIGTILVGAGAYVAQAGQHDREITALRAEVAAHVAAAGHPVEVHEIDTLTSVLAKVVDKTERIDRNVVVLCDRNHANCERQQQ